MCLLMRMINKSTDLAWNYLKTSLKKYIADNQIQLEIEAAADLIFLEFKSNKLYRYINDVREEFFDQIVQYTVGNHNVDIKPKLDELCKKKKIGKKKYEITLAFFQRLAKIIVDIQAKYINPELKILLKSTENLIDKSEQNIISEIAGVKSVLQNINNEDKSKNEKAYENIGILSYSITEKKDDSRIKSLVELKEKTLDLSCDFQNFYVNHYDVDWNNINKKVVAFISLHLKSVKDYLLLISANYSVVYAFGKQLGIKGSNIAVVNRNQIWDKQDYINEKIDFIKYECLCDKADVLNLVISIGLVNIIDEVKELYDNKNEHWTSLYYNKFINSNNEFWSIVREINNIVASIVRKQKIKLINIYFKGAAELLFALGQLSNNWCECQIKEYNFLEIDNSKRKYFNGIKI